MAKINLGPTTRERYESILKDKAQPMINKLQGLIDKRKEFLAKQIEKKLNIDTINKEFKSKVFKLFGIRIKENIAADFFARTCHGGYDRDNYGFCRILDSLIDKDPQMQTLFKHLDKINNRLKSLREEIWLVDSPGEIRTILDKMFKAF